MWLERDDSVPDAQTVDVRFRLDCAQLPVDHAQALFHALATHVPWLEHTGAIQSIGAASGNGWQRPRAADGELLTLSRRTRLRLRVPRARAQALVALHDVTLDVAGHRLTLKDSSIRELVPEPTLYARRIVVDDIDDEQALLDAVTAHLASLDIAASKLLCGRASTLALEPGTVATRGVMVAELLPHESLRLQDVGFGNHQHLGCGVFVPHKNIAPV